MCVVLSGEVEIQLDGEPFRMSASDCIEYSSATPHRVVSCRVVNYGSTTAEVQWIVAPPTVPAIPNKVVKSGKGLVLTEPPFAYQNASGSGPIQP
jgi:hypothetical protein